MSFTQKVISQLSRSFFIFWILTESDFCTFVIPDTAFGVLGALAGPVLTTNSSPSSAVIFSRLPNVLAWNWLNLAVFDLANQRSPESATEDTLNKPWRPVPAGFATTTQMRRLLLMALPLVLAINYLLGAWQETALLFGLTWMYNDLGGGDEDFLSRNLIIAIAFACYNSGSLRVACGVEHSVHSNGLRWVVLIAAVIFCTMHVQDLKDVAGDRARNRRTVPLVLGDSLARWTIVVPVATWSVVCLLYLGVGILSSGLLTALGAYVAFRVLFMRDPKADRVSWYAWACWLICLYALPLAKYYGAASDMPLF